MRGLRSRANLHPDTRDLLLIEMAMTNDSLALVEVYVNADYGYEVSAEVVCQRGSAITTLADTALVRAEAQARALNSQRLAGALPECLYSRSCWNGSNPFRRGRPFGGANTWDGYMTMLITGSCIELFRGGAVKSLKVPDKPVLYQ